MFLTTNQPNKVGLTLIKPATLIWQRLSLTCHSSHSNEGQDMLRELPWQQAGILCFSQSGDQVSGGDGEGLQD
jgi:hypothetical protein